MPDILSRMDAEQLDELSDVFAALGNPLRLRIIEVLSQHRELCVCEIGDRLPELSQSGVSRHLAVLKNVGLVRDRKQGLWVFCSLDLERLGRLPLGVLRQMAEDARHAPEEEAAARVAGRTGARRRPERSQAPAERLELLASKPLRR